jgi:hypothetical protein
MGVVALCTHLPCKLYPVVNTPTSSLGRATPFLIGIVILLVSVVTTHEVIRHAEEHVLKSWTPEALGKLKPHRSPETYVLGLPWVVDVAQMPALLGTPISGLFVLKHTNFLLLYTVVLAIGMVIFFYCLQKVPVNSYGQYAHYVLGYRVSLLVIGGVGLNLVCAALAAWAVN